MTHLFSQEPEIWGVRSRTFVAFSGVFEDLGAGKPSPWGPYDGFLKTRATKNTSARARCLPGGKKRARLSGLFHGAASRTLHSSTQAFRHDVVVLCEPEMLEYLSALFLPIQIHLFFQERIEVSVGSGETFSNHYLSATLLHIPEELLVVGIKSILFFRRGGNRSLRIQRLEISYGMPWRYPRCGQQIMTRVMARARISDIL